MLRSIMGTIGLMMVIGTSSADQGVVEMDKLLPGTVLELDLSKKGILVVPEGIAVAPVPSTSVSAAKEKRIAACVEFGNSKANCTCRAETAERFLSDDDFIEESGYIERGDHAGLTDFHHRKVTEQPQRMLQMGEALSECPADRFALE